MSALNTAPRIEPTQTGQTGHTGSSPGLTATGLSGRDVTRTGMQLVPSALKEGQVPASAEQIAADVRAVRGLRFDQVLLITTLLIVGGIVAALGSVFTFTAERAFQEADQQYTASLQEQAREMGQKLSSTIAQTGRVPMRDNDYGYFKHQVAELVKQNPNVARVRIYNHEGLSIADSDGDLRADPSFQAARGFATAIYKGTSVFEFREPIEFGGPDGAGLVVLTYSLDRLQGLLTEMEQKKQQTLDDSTTRTLALGGLFMVLAGVVAALVSRRVTRPLGILTQSVMRLAEGHFEARVDARAGSREVKTLGIVFDHMAGRINLLMQDVRQKALLEREMEVAKTVQQTLLPNRDVFPIGPMRIAGTSFAADACGGDWWIRSPLGPTRVVIGIGDVTGHGLSTALVATSATAGFSSAITLHEPGQIHAKLLMNSLNQTLFQLSRGEFQMSTSLAVVDLASGELEFASGGHPPAQVFNRHDGKVSSLNIRGPILGESEHSDYATSRYTLRPGDVLVWYSDGLTEANNVEQKPYSLKRLQNSLRQFGYLPVDQLRDALINDVQQYMAGAPQADDVTIVVAEYAQ
ncbi:MAG: SpoIIE family protein phosphatase [Myxococcota bacterium]|nr:SpoIIE family protein phosphatase [Myxococcota bacterium]